MEFAAEDSWRGASNSLKVIVPATLSHVCRNSEVVVRVGNEATARKRWWSGPIVETFLRRSPERQQLLEALCRRLNCFRTLNTSPGVVGGQWTSANRNKLFDSRPAVLSPFIACRRCQHLYYCIYCYCFIFTDLCSFIKLSFLYFLIISQVTHSLQGNQTVAVN